MNPIQNIELYTACRGTAHLRYRPAGQDHILFLRQRPAEGKAAGVTRYYADNLAQWSNAALGNDGATLTFTGAKWPYLTTENLPAKGSPFNAHNGPAAVLQINGLTPGETYDAWLVALSALAPDAYQTLYSDDKGGYSSRVNPLDANCDIAHGMCGLGSDGGCLQAADEAGVEFCLVNGQNADPTANPQIVAEAVFSFTVPDLDVLIGSQLFSDDFTPEPTFSEPVIGPAVGRLSQVMTTAHGPWQIDGFQLDTNNSRATWHANHIMPINFGGGTEGSSNPPHTNYGSLAWTAPAMFDFTGGRILAVDFWADLPSTARAYLSFSVMPDEPLLELDFEQNKPVNASNRAIFVTFKDNVITTTQLKGSPQGTMETGPAGPAPAGKATYVPLVDFQYAWPTDCRTHIQFFMDSAGRIALYLNGARAYDVEMSAPMNLALGEKVVFRVENWCYHRPIDKNVLPIQQIYPQSDERHIGTVKAWVMTDWEALPVSAPTWEPVVPSLWQPPTAATLLDAVLALNAPPVPTVPVPPDAAALFMSLQGPVTLEQLREAEAAIEALEKAMGGN